MIKFRNGWTKEKVIKHIEQNFKGKAYDENLCICRYKTEDGKKCAVGLFIPKSHEAYRYEGCVDALIQEYKDLKKVLPMDLESLRKIQNIHDLGNTVFCTDEDFRTNEEILMDLISFIESES